MTCSIMSSLLKVIFIRTSFKCLINPRFINLVRQVMHWVLNLICVIFINCETNKLSRVIKNCLILWNIFHNLVKFSFKLNFLYRFEPFFDIFASLVNVNITLVIKPIKCCLEILISVLIHQFSLIEIKEIPWFLILWHFIDLNKCWWESNFKLLFIVFFEITLKSLKHWAYPSFVFKKESFDESFLNALFKLSFFHICFFLIFLCNKGLNLRLQKIL